MRTIREVLARMTVSDHVHQAEIAARSAKVKAMDAAIESGAGNRSDAEREECRRLGRPEYLFVKNAQRKIRLLRRVPCPLYFFALLQ